MATKNDDAEKTRLRARIAQLTKREPRTDVSLSYLRTRVRMLEQQRRDGDDVREHIATEERTRPHSISLTEAQAEALSKLCDKTKKKASALVRSALALYAIHHGHASIARAFDDTHPNSKEH